jgi:putative tricarboxylic transport membrane protein
MRPSAGHRVDPTGLVIGALLLLLAGIVAFDASRLQITSTYGLGPWAMPYLVAAGLAVLALGNVVSAWLGGLPPREEVDWSAVLIVLAGLAGLIVVIGIGGGFIVAVALLFAATATAMGRRRPAVDLGIGLGLGLLVYVMFAKLLALSLPAGPIERLI